MKTTTNKRGFQSDSAVELFEFLLLLLLLLFPAYHSIQLFVLGLVGRTSTKKLVGKFELGSGKPLSSSGRD